MTTSNDTLKASVQIVSEPWVDSAYYDEAEQWAVMLWHPDYPFLEFFDRLDLTRTLELAVGHGRHAEFVQPLAGSLILMDVVKPNLDYCEERFSGRNNIRILHNNGYDYRPVEDDSLTAIYCYDAMVHFSPDIVESYLLDTARVLSPGGRALFHHSNYPAPLDRHYGQNPHARNHMTRELFIELAGRAELNIVESRVIPWVEVENLDCLTLVEKPGR
jgi:SAM-dependent methyltransferase